MRDQSRTTFLAYLTSHALTEGIVLRTVEDCFDTSRVDVANSGGSGECYFKPDWHRSSEEALARAEEMRQKAIAETEKKLRRLRAMTFTVPTETHDA